MSTLYTSLQVSPKKKRCPPELDDANILTPKKLRTAPPTPPASTSRTGLSSKQPMPPHLTRLYNIQTALHHALSHALATCAISPTSDSGIVRNVLDHMSLTTYAGFGTSFDIDDLKRLCWIWEWDTKSIVTTNTTKSEEEDDPFLESSTSDPPPMEWTRGSMGLVLSSATHYSRVDRKRVPAYGIGIEVEMDIDKDMGEGMAAVARWTATAEKRRSEFRNKLEHWITLHRDAPSVPNIPLANLPELSGPKVSALTRTLASCSPSSVTSIKFPVPPSSPSRSPTKKSIREPALPLATTPSASKSPFKKSSILFPQTPSRRDQLNKPMTMERPQTPSSSNASPSKDSVPSTPKHQTGFSTDTSGTTPSTSRRQALYERVRQRSLSMSPTKAPRPDATTPSMTRDQMLKMSQDEMRRRCLLGRLGGVAESIWMLFSNPTTGSSSTPGRKRRALPMTDVITAIVKSSPVPISTAEANESMSMLIKLCPFFVKKFHISGKEWIEMPASNIISTAVSTEGTLTKNKPNAPFSPGRLKGKDESAQELVTRSPRRVKREGGGLREVREIIRRELDLQD